MTSHGYKDIKIFPKAIYTLSLLAIILFYPMKVVTHNIMIACRPPFVATFNNASILWNF